MEHLEKMAKMVTLELQARTAKMGTLVDQDLKAQLDHQVTMAPPERTVLPDILELRVPLEHLVTLVDQVRTELPVLQATYLDR